MMKCTTDLPNLSPDSRMPFNPSKQIFRRVPFHIRRLGFTATVLHSEQLFVRVGGLEKGRGDP